MNPKVSELKMDKAAKFPLYNLVVLIIDHYSNEWGGLSWIDVQKIFHKWHIKCDCLVFNYNSYLGLIFNNFLFVYEGQLVREYPLLEVCKVGNVYYKYKETINYYDLFKRVSKKEVKGKTFFTCERKK